MCLEACSQFLIACSQFLIAAVVSFIHVGPQNLKCQRKSPLDIVMEATPTFTCAPLPSQRCTHPPPGLAYSL